jgi:hypothetical protein
MMFRWSRRRCIRSDPAASRTAARPSGSGLPKERSSWKPRTMTSSMPPMAAGTRSSGRNQRLDFAQAEPWEEPRDVADLFRTPSGLDVLTVCKNWFLHFTFGRVIRIGTASTTGASTCSDSTRSASIPPDHSPSPTRSTPMRSLSFGCRSSLIPWLSMTDWSWRRGPRNLMDQWSCIRSDRSRRVGHPSRGFGRTGRRHGWSPAEPWYQSGWPAVLSRFPRVPLYFSDSGFHEPCPDACFP